MNYPYKLGDIISQNHKKYGTLSFRCVAYIDWTKLNYSTIDKFALYPTIYFNKESAICHSIDGMNGKKYICIFILLARDNMYLTKSGNRKPVPFAVTDKELCSWLDIVSGALV